MNKRKALLIGLLIVIALVAFYVGFRKTNKKPETHTSQIESKVYWTCPMHPHIHSDKPGECPICHMTLVKMTEQKKSEETETESSKRASISVSNKQLELIGIHKHIVEKMTLTATIPVSGRFLSSSSIAFQVYEKDLRYVRAGLTFRGTNSVYPETAIEGKITSVDSIADPSSRTVRVIGNVHKGPRGIIAESSLHGEIELDLKDRVAIPESAVLHSGTKDLVYIFGQENRLKAQPVALGLKALGFYEVLEGLKPGDEISSGPNFLIDSEAKIRGSND